MVEFRLKQQFFRTQTEITQNASVVLGMEQLKADCFFAEPFTLHRQYLPQLTRRHLRMKVNKKVLEEILDYPKKETEKVQQQILLYQLK